MPAAAEFEGEGPKALENGLPHPLGVEMTPAACAPETKPSNWRIFRDWRAQSAGSNVVIGQARRVKSAACRPRPVGEAVCLDCVAVHAVSRELRSVIFVRKNLSLVSN